MKVLRVSKLEGGQQWGKNTSSKDKVEWGRRPPLIGAPELNRYVLCPRTSGTTARAVEHRERSKAEGEAEPYERHYRWGQRYYRWQRRNCCLASGTTIGTAHREEGH